MKKFLLSTLASFLVLNCYAEEVIGDPPIDEPTEQITLEEFLKMPLSQVSDISMNKQPISGLPDNIYSELTKISDSYNGRGKGILLSIANELNNNPHIFCNKGYSYEAKNIHINCNNSFQDVISILDNLKLQKKDWEPKYSFWRYKRMTLLDLAEKLLEGVKTKEFDIDDVREDLTHFLTEEYGNFGYVLVNDGSGLLSAISACVLAKESGIIHRQDTKKFCNLSKRGNRRAFEVNL